MQLPSSMTFAAIETYLDKACTDSEVLLPTHGKHQAAGAEAALVQALATWANGNQVSTLRTYATSEEDDQIIDLLRRLYGMSACALADRIETIARADITSKARIAAMRRMTNLAAEAPTAISRGPQVEIVCADHLAISAPSSLYTFDDNGMPVVKPLPAFLELVERTVLSKLLARSYRNNLPAQFENTLSVSLYELIRNTDEHGRQDDLGNSRRKSLRGFQARKHTLTPKSLSDITAASPPMARYCDRLVPARVGNAQVQLIELSIFDSGPGMAASLTGKPLRDLAPEDEREAVLRCFEKRISRKNTSSAGLGLPNLANAMTSVGGFMRVRTGRCALYHDFANEPSVDYGAPLELRDGFNEPGQGAPVVGTLFTLLFPLKA